MFEISALSWTQISISVEHPMEESMATAEIDLSDISNLICRIHNPGTPPPPNTPDIVSEMATKHLNRCFSIPVTMRSVIRYWDKQATRKNHYNGHENFNLPLGSGDPGGRNGNPGGNTLPDFGGLEGKLKQEPGNGTGLGHGMNLPMMSHQHAGAMFLNDSIMNSANFSNFPTSSDPNSVLTNLELTNILAGTTGVSSEKPKRHKRKNEDNWKSSKRRAGDDSDLLDGSSCDSTSRSTPLSQETCSEIPTPNSALGFHSDFDSLDPTELISDKSVPEFEGVDDLGDVEDILEGGKFRRKTPPPLELDNKVPPSVSITPIPTSISQGFTQSSGRPGIEIIPISTSPATSLPSSITITPIPTSQTRSEEKSREKKSSKSKSEDKNKLEKKRKRKREESPMGPPEKIPTKQDPLSKPVSVSIKPAESPPLPSMTPTSPSMSRKYTTSPTQSRKISSPNLLNPGIKASSTHQSPKHSPISSSPKHTIPGISSPKSHGLSPKHPSTSGSGKPSMSTLKNAANSPSSKSGDSSKSKSSGKESSRDKEKRTSGVFSAGNSNKKSTSVKVKQLDLNAGMEIPVQDSLPSPSGTVDLTKNPNQARNRKAGLLAVIDKLKSAQCDTATDLSSKSSKERQQISNKTSESSKSNNKVGENKNSEYMVKPSSDGIKITINKTRTKDSKSSSTKSSTSGTGSPKTHTGLKPGVNSGPASKKPQQLGKSSSTSNLTNSTSSNYGGNFKSVSSNKSSGTSSSSTNIKSGSSGNIVKNSKVGTTPDLNRTKDRPKPNKSSEKSIFSNREGRKGSPTQSRDETDGFKLNLSKMDPYAAPLMVEGFKQFDKKFHIPKLSARSSDDKKLKTSTSEVLNNINQSVDSTKMFDMITKNDVSLKYTMPLPSSKMFENSMENKIRNSMNNVSLTTSPKLPSQGKDQSDFGSDSSDEKKRDYPQNLTTSTGSLGKDEIAYKLNYNPISASKSFSTSAANEPLSLSTKSVDLTSKFIAPAPKDDKKELKVKCSEQDGLLDYSKSDKMASQALPTSMGFPHSPSVSVHIVKSPAPSPMINPSPHSASPCITDDELMDEALVGLGK